MGIHVVLNSSISTSAYANFPTWKNRLMHENAQYLSYIGPTLVQYYTL